MTKKHAHDPLNILGDGRPYVTTHLFHVTVAEDGEAIMEVTEEDVLTASERTKLVNVRPSKFDPPEDEVRNG